jgi:N-acetylglucosamine kinase
MNTRWAIGVDAGGTKTTALAKVIDTRQPLRHSEGGPCNIAAMTPQDAAGNINACLNQLGIPRADISSICIGAAGYSAVDRRRSFMKLVQADYQNAVLDVVSDCVIAHAGAFADGIGVIVIAGTGSIAYGVNKEGETAYGAGYGYLIDDSGSGYGLGRQVLLAASKSFDGVSGFAALTALFTERTGIRSREDLIRSVYGGPLGRAEIAALAPMVADAASSGDSHANALLMHAGGALARVAQTVILKLFRKQGPISVAKIGSLWSAGEELSAVFERSLLRSAPDAKIVSPAAGPADGALVRALANLTN